MFSAAIVHNPASGERACNVRALLGVLSHAQSILDDGTGVLVRRRVRWGCWPIAKRAWESFDETATHHLVLEDDAQLCDDFALRLASVIEQAPDACLSLFRGARDCSVATVMPSRIVRRFIDWCETSPRGHAYLPHHDYLIAAAMRALGVRRLYAKPSIVEHRSFASMLDHQHVSAFHFASSPMSIDLVE